MVSLSNHERKYVRPSARPFTLSLSKGDRQRGLILVVAAVPQELRDFRAAGDRGTERLVTGMGRRAGEAVQRRLGAGGVGLVISAGFAGGTRSGFHVGDLVAASEVINAASGRRWQPAPLSSRSNLNDELGPGCAISVGPFVTIERALPAPAFKAQTGTRYGAIAVDMETAFVAQAAEGSGVPWMALRAILDPMEVPLQISSMGQALRMLAVPTRWKQLSNFMQSVETAGRSLAEGLNLLILNEGENNGSG